LQIEKKVENELVNIGAGEEFEIKFFARLICKIVDFDYEKIIYNKDKYVGAKSKNLSIKKNNKIIPNYKNITLQEGLKETILDISDRLQGI